MIRTAVLFLLCLGLLLLLSPFVISSLLIDQHGTVISGQVRSKEERVVVHYSSWTRFLDVTVQYEPPQESGVAFLTAQVDPDRFDALKNGEVVQLRYLRREEVPHIPGADTLRQLHMLPTVRLADQRAWSGLQAAARTASAAAIAGLVALVALVLWRIARMPLFGWAVGICILSVVAVQIVCEFPAVVPPPRQEVRSALGAVKSLDRVEWLLRGNHQKGFKADQPIQVVGVQFVPEGRTEPVLAVDLIDAGSVSGLQEHALISLDYERGAPRTARIRGATRQFVRRNLQGIAVELGASLAVITILLFGSGLLGKAYRRLSQRPR